MGGTTTASGSGYSFLASGYESHVYRCCRAVISVKGKLAPEELAAVTQMFAMDLPKQ